ncbi:protein FAM153A isoform X3 [Callithrix jacchus]
MTSRGSRREGKLAQVSLGRRNPEMLQGSTACPVWCTLLEMGYLTLRSLLQLEDQGLIVHGSSYDPICLPLPPSGMGQQQLNVCCYPSLSTQASTQGHQSGSFGGNNVLIVTLFSSYRICSSRKPSWDKFNRTSYSHLQELEDSIAGSHRQVEERSKPAEKATKKLKVKKERKTSKPRKNTRRHAQNILHICKIS